MSAKNRITICSDVIEKTTDMVIQYLTYYKYDVQRFHNDNVIKNLNIEIYSTKEKDSSTLFCSKKDIYLNANEKMWYRRGDFSYQFPINVKGSDQPILKKYLEEEWQYVKEYLHRHNQFLGYYYAEKRCNKLIDLINARESGLKIPETLVTSNKKKVREFIKKHKLVITKPIHNGHISFKEGSSVYSGKGIVILNKDMINSSSDSFSLSLFQEYIPKQYEIRIFFLGKKLFSMAIFSQLDSKTKYDFRNYNRSNPNRNVPYKLPERIALKIRRFIEISSLDTGSIDLIYCNDNNYVFLEVNPVGQFGWVSANCNYYLEKKIAQYIIYNDKDKQV